MRWPSFVVPAALLFLLPPATPAAAGADRPVPAGGDLQRALNEARPGDRILLEPGATYSGNFVLPVHGGSDYITVTTNPAAADLPAAGRRITHELLGTLARIQSPNNEPAVRTAPRARFWRLQLLEFPGGRSADIIALGDGGPSQRALSDVPSDLVVDRCYIHGDGSSQKRGIALNSGRTSIVNSYIGGIARAGQDTQAIGGWNGPGPYLIENNRLEAAAENFMLGGAAPAIHGLIPSDVTFRRNFVTKPADWRDRKVSVKNLFELKNARRVLVEFNVFERNWSAAQTGFAIVLTPRGESGRTPWATVEDVTFRYNIVRHAGGGINVLGHDDAGPSGQLRGLRISHNLFYDIDDDTWGGSGAFVQIGAGPADIIVEHNTVWHTGTAVVAYGGSRDAPATVRGFVFRDNLMRHNRYGVHGQGRAVGNDTLNVFFPGAVFERNVLAGGRSSLYPADNLFPSIEEFQRQFVDVDGRDFRLVPDSSFRGKASDGDDLGADIGRIASGVPEDDRQRERERLAPRKPGP